MILFSGEGEGSPEDNDKIDGDDESGTMTPNSAVSPAPGGDEASSPPPGALLSPKSPHSVGGDSSHCNQQTDKLVFFTSIQNVISRIIF